MGSGNGDYADWRRSQARLEKAISDAGERVKATADEETALSRASWLTETLRQATNSAGSIRAHAALRFMQARNLSIGKLGGLMGVSKATAQGLVERARQETPPAVPPDPTMRPERQPIAAAIVTASGRVLVGKRNDRTPPWTFIAGEIEPGETSRDAATREVKEETGLEVTIGRELGRRIHPATGVTMIYLTAEPVRDTDIFVGDRAELAEVRWVGFDEAVVLLPGMFGPVRSYLARELKRNGH